MNTSSEVTHVAGRPISAFGDTMKIEGLIVGDGESRLYMFLPGEGLYPVGEDELVMTHLGLDEALAWLKQSDDPVAPIYERGAQNVPAYDRHSFVKALIRKSSRQVDQNVAWTCYARDGYECRYCGATEVPLTYDHLLAQAFGGLTTVENGVSACRPCNKAKGHKTLAEWVEYMTDKGMKYAEYWSNQAKSR